MRAAGEAQSAAPVVDEAERRTGKVGGAAARVLEAPRERFLQPRQRRRLEAPGRRDHAIALEPRPLCLVFRGHRGPRRDNSATAEPARGCTQRKSANKVDSAFTDHGALTL